MALRDPNVSDVSDSRATVAPSLSLYRPPATDLSDDTGSCCTDDPPAPTFGAAYRMQYVQHRAALERLHADVSLYPRFPWASVHGMTGAMMPGEMWVLCGRTGHGKSKFCTHALDAWVRAGVGVCYCGLERPVMDLRITWACEMSGIAPRTILKPEPADVGEDWWKRHAARVEDHLAWQRSEGIRERAHFASARYMDAERLRAWTAWAVSLGCQIVVVDHVNRIDHGDGFNSFDDFSRTIRLAKELAVHHGVVMLLVAQLNRAKGGDPMARIAPPQLSDIRGGGTAEEEADEVLGVCRPLQQGMTLDRLRQVRLGLAPEHDLYQPNAMAVHELKNRVDGAVRGRSATLWVANGVLEDPHPPARPPAHPSPPMTYTLGRD